MTTKTSAHSGFAYVEILIAVALIAIVLPSALSAVQTASANAVLGETFSTQHEARVRRLEELKTKPFPDLVAAAETAGGSTVDSRYSDPSGTPNRLTVRIAAFDADDDPFLVNDDNFDGDGNLYTGYQGLLWLEVATENTPDALITLLHPATGG